MSGPCVGPPGKPEARREDVGNLAHPMDAEALEQAALAAVAAAATADDVERVRVEYLGRKSALKLALREVRDRETGMTLNAARERIEAAVEARDEELQRAELDRRLTEERRRRDDARDAHRLGHSPPHRRHRRVASLEDTFLGLGYTIVDDREVETVHGTTSTPSTSHRRTRRGRPETLFLDEETVLRTETSPAQIRTMEQQEPPVYVVSIGRVYRRDTPDATRHADLPSSRGARRGRRITLADLMGTLDYLLSSSSVRPAVAASSRTTSPSPSRRSRRSSRVTSATGPAARYVVTPGWIEVGGSGMVDPQVFEFVGHDAERYTGFAFGWGLERHRGSPARDPGSARALAQRPASEEQF